MENTQSKEPIVTSNGETATATTAEDSTVVTSASSPVTDNGFQPFQQLHEAVLAAVNSHSGSLPNSIFSAVAAAAAANGNVQSFDQPADHQKANMTDAEMAKRQSIRASNRERKKKWRLHNEERNKDNDLRCRVNKRANKLYGASDSPAKQQWINEEFEKRRQKRMEKDRRKHITNSALTGPSNVTSTTNTATNSIPITDIVNNQMSAYYPPLPQIDTETAAKLLDFPSDLQRQLLEQLNNSMLALTNGMQHAAQAEQTHNNSETVSSESHPVNPSPFTNTTTKTEDGTASEDNSASTENNNNQNNESTNTTDTTVAGISTDALQQAIAQGLSSSTSVTENSNHNSPMPYTGPTDMEVDEPTPIDQKTQKAVKEEVKEEKKEGTDEENKGEKKQEYPMDAVLTLMQLNAGWRQ